MNINHCLLRYRYDGNAERFVNCVDSVSQPMYHPINHINPVQRQCRACHRNHYKQCVRRSALGFHVRCPDDCCESLCNDSCRRHNDGRCRRFDLDHQHHVACSDDCCDDSPRRCHGSCHRGWHGQCVRYNETRNRIVSCPNRCCPRCNRECTIGPGGKCGYYDWHQQRYVRCRNRCC